MQTQRQNGTLTVTGLRELNAVNSRSFRAAVCEALSPDVETIEIDLSQTKSVDGCGMGALMSLYNKVVKEHPGRGAAVIRLLHPSPPVRQMIELTRLHHLFEVTPP